MIKNNELTFNRFYITEFLQEVINKIPENITKDNADLARELILHLTKQDDVADGIELIAREQGSGELSIFLFDIVDRVEDYPPTVAYDALPDIVDDFVSGLDLMLEEDETVAAIKSVNQRFRKTSGEVAEEVKPEIVEQPEIIEEATPVTEDVELLSDTEEKIPEEEIPVPAEVVPEPQEPAINFEQFFEQEFMQKLSANIDSDLDNQLKPSIKSFCDLILENLSTDIDPKIPQPLTDTTESFRSAFPWRIANPYGASELVKEQDNLIQNCMASLKKLASDYPDIISASVVQARIVLPEPVKPETVEEKEVEEEKPVTEFVQEEIPQEPTTIDAILSEYFQSEVEEHINTLSEIIEKLKSDPGSAKIIKELITSLQSFNEISMIHGYAPIESFCGHLIDIFSSGLKDKMQVDPDQISLLPEVFEILHNTNNLKDAKEETEESKKLEDITHILTASLFVAKEKAPAKPSKKKGKKVKPVKAVVTEIPFKNKETLAEIIKEIFILAKPDILNDFDTRDSFTKSREFFLKMQSAADMVKLGNISKCIGLFLTVTEDATGPASDNLKTVFSEFVENIAKDIKLAKWKTRIKKDKAAAKEKAGADEISIENAEQLAAIIAEIEEKNLASFGQELQDIFEQKSIDACQRQIAIFSRLKNNLLLIGANEKTMLADYFCDLFSNPDSLPAATADQRNEVEQSYKMFIQSLRSKQSSINTEDLVSILEEMFTAPESEILEPESGKEDEIADDETKFTEFEEEGPVTEDLLKPAEAVEVEETEQAHDEGDEDLAEIFKQEAQTALNQINDALQKLDKDFENTEDYQTIERNTHSLKSSARLLGNSTVANLAAPLEELCEKLASGSYQPEENHRELVKETVTTLTSIIDGGDDDGSEMIKKLNAIEFPEIIEEEAAPAEREEVSSIERPLFSSESDEDDDLLQIFKEESAEFVKLLKEASEDLKKDPADQNAINMLEHASHSLKSPAKMLGFTEIGQMGDVIENIAEAAKKNELQLNQSIVKKVTDAIGYIGELSEGKKLDPLVMTEIFSSMEVSKIGQLKDDAPDEAVSDPENISVFLTEAQDLLEKINHDMLNLEKNPDDKEILDSISRYLHTLKGSAQIMGQEKIGNLAHAIEDIFSHLKENEKQIPEKTSDLVFRAIDGIQTMTHDMKTGKEESGKLYQELILSLSNEVNSLQKDEEEVVVPVIRPVEIDTAPELPKDVEKTIKITTDRLDNFVNMAAELVINKTQLADQLEKLKEIRLKIEDDSDKLKKAGNEIESILGKKSTKSKNSAPTELIHDFEEIMLNLDDLSHRVSVITQKFDQNINQISHLSKSLHDNILQVRMVPTEVLFSRFPRAVRDMAKKQKKKINLLVEGEDTEMDRAMIESLTEPVMHLVRNAIDHGIEMPKERKEKDKNEDGILLLKARRDKNQVIIEVQDDGQGLNVEDISRTIVQKKLATKSEIEKLSEDEILDYIFHPGFTTKKTATKVSGRGVGLDVVADEIQKLKGDIRVSSTPGKGTIFGIRLPLTLAITQALIIEIKGETLAIPLNSVEETQDFEENKIVLKGDKKYLKVRKSDIPVAYLSEFIKYDKEAGAEKDTGNIIIIQDGSVRYGLIIDRALRREEIVVRSLGDELENMEYIAGGTIFGDGSVVLIIDIPAITRKIEMDYFGDQRDFSSLESARDMLTGSTKKPAARKKATVKRKNSDIKKKKIEERKPAALIVDDSLSVRKFVSSVLERNNYSTALAEDGPEALEELKASEFDIIITDLEMPKMQGFELIEKIRDQKKLQDVPIIILTGKAAKENKEKGIQLGANAYIVKPFKENDLLKMLEQFIQI